MRFCCPYEAAKFQGRLWTPAVLRPLFWYDAADLRYVVRSGSSVTTWRDRGGRYDLETQGASPGWSNEIGGALTFDGSTQSLQTISTMTMSSDYTFAALIKPSAQLRSINTLIDLDHANTPNGPFVVQNETNRPAPNNYYPAFHNGSAFQVTGPPFLTPTVSTWSVILSGKLGSSVTGRVNGVVGASWPTTVTGNPNTQAKQLTVGNCQFTPNRWWTGSIAALIIVPSSSDAITAKIEASLLWPRGLQALLPANHRFKDRPPYLDD